MHYDDLTASERRFVEVRLRRLQALGGMALGTYAEAVVAEALPGAVESEAGTDRVDMVWDGRAIEVKCTRGTKWGVAPSYKREDGVKVRRRRADLYVLAQHHGDDHRVGWSFYVVPRWRLDDHGHDQVTVSRLSEWGYVICGVEDLPSAVAASDISKNTPVSQVESQPGAAVHWERMRVAPRRHAGSLELSDIPDQPGVYAWFMDGEPMYAGRALAKGGLRRRVGRGHLATGLDLSHSSFRRNVCEHVLGVPTAISRRRPPVLTKDQVRAVNDWIGACEVAWLTFATPAEAADFEKALLAEWKPPLSKR